MSFDIDDRLARLGLGTAQFSPTSATPGGRPRMGEAMVRAILDGAQQSGVTLVDTGASGDAERMLGQSWPFPSPFRVTTRTLRLEEGLDRVEHRARRSLERLGVPRAHGLLVGATDDLLTGEGRDLWARLEKLKGEGLYQKIGFSAQSDDDVVGLAKRYRPDLVQLPVSLLDQRRVTDGTLAALADMGVEVQLRSVFLKGLLFMERESLPPCLTQCGPRLSRIRRQLAEAGADPLHAALSFALDRPEASGVIVGVGSAAELRAVVAAAHMPSPKLDWAALSLDDPAALDPSRWISSAA